MKPSVLRLGVKEHPSEEDFKEMSRSAEQRVCEILDITPAHLARLEATCEVKLLRTPWSDELQIVAQPEASPYSRLETARRSR